MVNLTIMNSKVPPLPSSSLLIPGKAIPSYKFHLYMAAEGAPAEPIPDAQGLIDLQTELTRLSNENQKKMMDLETHISMLCRWLNKKQDLSSVIPSRSSFNDSTFNSSSSSSSSSSLSSSSHSSSLNEKHRARSSSLTSSQSSLLKRDLNTSDFGYPSGKRRKSEQDFSFPSSSSLLSLSSLNQPRTTTTPISSYTLSSSSMDVTPSTDSSTFAFHPPLIGSSSSIVSSQSSFQTSVQYPSTSFNVETTDSISSTSVSAFPIETVSDRSSKDTFEPLVGTSHHQPQSSSVYSKHSSITGTVGDLSESSLTSSSLPPPPSMTTSSSSSSTVMSHPVTLNSSLSSSHSSVTLSNLNASLSSSTSSLSSSSSSSTISSGSGPKIKFKLDEFVKTKPGLKQSLSTSEPPLTSLPLDSVLLNESSSVDVPSIDSPHVSSLPSRATSSVSAIASLSQMDLVRSNGPTLELDTATSTASPSPRDSGSTSISAIPTSSSSSSSLPFHPMTTSRNQVSSQPDPNSLIDASHSHSNSSLNYVMTTVPSTIASATTTTTTTTTTTITTTTVSVPSVPLPPPNLSKNETFIFYSDRAYYYENFLTPDALRTMTEILKGEDFSKIAKLGQQIPITTFWSYLEPYFRPLTEDDVQCLKWKDDAEYAMYFKIPTLGSGPFLQSSQAYYEALSQSTWQVQQALGLSATSMPSSLAAWSLGHKHAVPLKTRMMACLLPELPPPSSTTITTSTTTSSSASHSLDAKKIEESIQLEKVEAEASLKGPKTKNDQRGIEMEPDQDSMEIDSPTLATASMNTIPTLSVSHQQNTDERNETTLNVTAVPSSASTLTSTNHPQTQPLEEASFSTPETFSTEKGDEIENGELEVIAVHNQPDQEMKLADTNGQLSPLQEQPLPTVHEDEPMEEDPSALPPSLDLSSSVHFNGASNSSSSLPSSLSSSSLNSSVSLVSLMSPSHSTPFPHPSQPSRHPASTYLGDPSHASGPHEMSDDSEDSDDSEEDRASHFDDDVHDDRIIDHVDVLNNTQDMEYLNERLKAELRSLGLWDTALPSSSSSSSSSSTSSSSMTVANEEDDMISVALRHHQSLLQEQCRINRSRQKHLLHLAYQYLGYQEYLHLLMDVNRQLEKAFQLKFGKPNVHLKKSKKSKPSSMSQSSSTSSSSTSTSFLHSLSNVEDPITGVSESILALIQHRHQLVQTIGRVFQGRENEFWKTPQVSIFSGLDKNVQLPDS